MGGAAGEIIIYERIKYSKQEKKLRGVTDLEKNSKY
jgi:hypothetical protein